MHMNAANLLSSYTNQQIRQFFVFFLELFFEKDMKIYELLLDVKKTEYIAYTLHRQFYSTMLHGTIGMQLCILSVTSIFVVSLFSCYK